MAHITGGGFVENIPRVLPKHLKADIDYKSWPMPPLFELIQKTGNIPDSEMYRVFNMGIGMVVITAPEHAAALQAKIAEPTWIIGNIKIS